MKYHLTFTHLFILLIGTQVFGVNVNNKIDDGILAILPRSAQVGIIVKSLNNDQLIYEHNADQFFMPASTLKILTSIAALKRLGPDFTYSTQLLAKADSDSCKSENLYLKFSGDPSLRAKDLTKLFSTLTQSEIHHIAGNLIYDDPGYKIPAINPGWMISDIDTCEMVPVSKAIIDQNYYHFEICPAKALSEASILKTELGIEPRYEIDNQVITTRNEDYLWRSYSFVGNTLRIQGKAGITLKPQRIELPIDNLDFYIQQNIAKALKESGITLEGQIIPGRSPSPQNTIILAEHKSAALKNILSQALKHSENLPFGALLLELASLDNPSATSWRSASNTITEGLQNYYSIDLTGAVIDDGIGLSRYNLISPRQLLDVLIAAYKDPSISNYFIDALAQNGKPGTLKNRMLEAPLSGRIDAKDGGMSGISALVGYLKTNKGNLLSFVIFVNSFSGRSLTYRDFQDNVCRILIEGL